MVIKLRKKKIETKYIVFIIIIIIIAFLIIFSWTLKTDRKLTKVEMVIKDGIVWTEKVLYAPVNYIINLINNYNNLKKVQEENDILKTNIEGINSLKVENIELKKQIESLKKELNIEYTLNDWTKINSTVLNRNPSYWFNSLTIDKGHYSDIAENMIVVNNSGLIGRISSTSIFTSTVKLITTTDTNNKISVSISNGEYNLNGLINGYNHDENCLIVEGISNTENVHEGDYIYTSGLGGIFPSGILVGTVKKTDIDEYGLSKILKVEPAVDFNNINYVSVLKRTVVTE